MSIALFGPSERSITETQVRPRRGRPPRERLAVARSDRAATPEAR